jgi:hypothetical protein
VLGCILARFGVNFGSILGPGVTKIPLKIHVKFHIEKSDPKVLKRDDEFLKLSASRCPGRGKGEGLVRSITEDFGDVI